MKSWLSPFSSHEWAAKGVKLLGVRAVIAKSSERIHRTNAVGMGVLLLQFAANEGANALKLTDKEFYSVTGISNALSGSMFYGSLPASR